MFNHQGGERNSIALMKVGLVLYTWATPSGNRKAHTLSKEDAEPGVLAVRPVPPVRPVSPVRPAAPSL